MVGKSTVESWVHQQPRRNKGVSYPHNHTGDACHRRMLLAPVSVPIRPSTVVHQLVDELLIIAVIL